MRAERGAQEGGGASREDIVNKEGGRFECTCGGIEMGKGCL